MQEADTAKADIQLVSGVVMKNYIAKFHLTEKYQYFDTYWKRFAYIEVVDKVRELYREVDTAKLRVRFLDRS